MTGHERDRILVAASERRRLARGGDRSIRRGVYAPRPDAMPRRIARLVQVPSVTSVARTLVDLARDSTRSVERLFDDAISRHLVDAAELERCALQAVPPRSAHRTAVRAQLERIAGGFVAPDSELERIALEAFAAWGCPAPVCQMDLPGREAIVGQVDFAWPQQRVIIEVDGRRHLLESQIERDRARDRVATIAGWRTLRYGWNDFHPARNRTGGRSRTRSEVRAALGLT